MNKKVGSLIFALLIIFLVVILILTYKIVSDVKVDIPKVDFVNDKNEDIKMSHDGSWVEKFSEIKMKNYSLPATEISVKLNLNEESQKDYKFRILVDNINEFQFFNLKQILITQNIYFSYFNQENSIKVVILTNSKETLQDLLNSLEKYSIDYTLEK